jgi:hypothetical protein
MDINATRMFLQLTESVCRMRTNYSHGLTLNYPQLLSVGNDSNTASSGSGQEGGEGEMRSDRECMKRNETSMSSTFTRANVL